MPKRPQMSTKIAAEEAEMIVQFVVPGLTNLLPAFALNVVHAQQVSNPKTGSTGVPNTT